ncbi:AAA family ATPase [Embleya sp. NPDC005971]|uniref:AAA family ATPase n=1 Tax=Embleya sp. NPDC005971 TaxID=3156724 RepID=UPI0033EB8BA3
MLHGRNDELAAVTALLQRTRAGDGGAVVLRGAAGTGKTTLLAEAMWEAKGMTVLRTAGPRGGGALPYTGLRQLLAGLHPRIGRLPHTRAQALRTALGLAPGAADRGVVAAAACSLILIAAREQPVLLLVDDTHWLDAASAAVVSYIAGRAEGLPIAVLRATREGASGAPKPTEGGSEGTADAASSVDDAAGADTVAADLDEPATNVATPSEATPDRDDLDPNHARCTATTDQPSALEHTSDTGTFEAGTTPDGAEREGDPESVAAPGESGTSNGSPAERPMSPGRAAGTDVFWGAESRESGSGASAGPVPGADRPVEAGRVPPSSETGRSNGRDHEQSGNGTNDASDDRSNDRNDNRNGNPHNSRHDDQGSGRDGGRGAAAEAGARRAGSGAAVAGGDVSFAALPEDARRLLALAALEPAADLDQLAVAGRRIGIGRSARLAVLRAGLVDAAEHRVRFRNAAAREEVRRSLTPAERRSLHGALVYAASGALAYRRPWHLAALATGPDADLAAALEAGAGRTRRELGAGAAAATWEQAARLTSDRPVARRRYVAAAYAAWEAGFPARARTLLDTADATDLDGVADEGSSAHSSGTAIRLRAALRHAEGHRSEAGALLLEAAHGRAALLLAATGAAWEAGDRARTTQARAALSALPLAADDPLRTVVAALGADGVSPAMVAPATRARLYGLGIALWEVTPLAVHAAATDQAAYEVLLDEAAVLRTHGARGALAAALMPLAVAGALSGRAVEAETHAAEGLRLARSTGQGTLAAWFLAALSMAATTQGRIAEARDGAWQALRLTGTTGLTPVGAYALYALAVVERAEGRTEAACELLAKALAAPAGALMEVRIRAELATAGPNRTGLAALPPRPTHPNTPPLALTARIPRTPQLATGSA